MELNELIWRGVGVQHDRKTKFRIEPRGTPRFRVQSEDKGE